MDKVNPLFAQRLQSIRQQKKMSQKDLAAQLGVTQGTVSRYEGGGDYPSLDVVVKLAQTLDATADYLLGISDYDTPLWLSRLQSEQEAELLQAFRVLSMKGQERVLGYLQCVKEKHT